MLCCTKCFGSNYLQEVINNEGTIGTCNFCGSTAFNVISTDSESLINIIAPFSQSYEIDNDSSIGLCESIFDQFGGRILSTDLTKEKGVLLLKEIFSTHRLIDQTVASSIINNPRLGELWDIFTKELKTSNRFHISNGLDLESLEYLFREFHSFTISEGTIFYRARRGRKLISEMGMPPPEKTSKGGRMNPIGIPYLYLARDIDTTLYEIRATLFDEISMGQFSVCTDINVCDLRKECLDICRLSEGDRLNDYLPYYNFVRKLEDEMSKPNLESEKELDYLPTQYLAEYIKVLGYDGILYSSSLHPDGYNLALFNEEVVECTGVKVHKIRGVRFDHLEIS